MQAYHYQRGAVPMNKNDEEKKEKKETKDKPKELPPLGVNVSDSVNSSEKLG